MSRSIKVLSMLGAIFLQFLFTSTVFAGAASELNVGIVSGSDGDWVYFNATPQPAHTCMLAGAYEFKFDATTHQGKIFLSLLLGAKLTGKQINVWYRDHTDGEPCTDGSLSVVTGVAVN